MTGANLATAAGKAVENVNGLPAPLALAVTIVMLAAALGWILFTVVGEIRKNQPKIKAK
jgi:hypothetical protein